MNALEVELRQAERDLKKLGVAVQQAGWTALKRTGGIVRRQYFAAIRKNGSKITGPFAPFNAAWYQLLGQGARTPGGRLLDSKLWPIEGSRADEVVVDIVPQLQGHLSRWQFGDAERANALRNLIAAWKFTDEGRRVYHGKLVKQGYPEHVSQLPPVTNQPVRDVVGPIRANAAAHLPEWFLGALRKISNGKARVFVKSALHLSPSTSRRRSASRRRSQGRFRDYASVKGRR